MVEPLRLTPDACPRCGMGIVKPHATEAECIEVLRGRVVWLENHPDNLAKRLEQCAQYSRLTHGALLAAGLPQFPAWHNHEGVLRLAVERDEAMEDALRYRLLRPLLRVRACKDFEDPERLDILEFYPGRATALARTADGESGCVAVDELIDELRKEKAE